MNVNNITMKYMNNQQNCNPIGIVNPGLNNNVIINGGGIFIFCHYFSINNFIE